jgi:hypothetical protein
LDLLALWSFERNPFKIQTTLSMWAAVFSFFNFRDVKWVWQIIPQQISQEWWWSNRKFSFNGKKIWGYHQKSRKLAQKKKKRKEKTVLHSSNLPKIHLTNCCSWMRFRVFTRTSCVCTSPKGRWNFAPFHQKQKYWRAALVQNPNIIVVN